MLHKKFDKMQLYVKMLNVKLNVTDNY